ncbi:hypothetical protein E4T42_09455 [Aureobasidium subglaciale]|nr:hypothetical protein E4T42_09455 [Aureobasidium subglaciale]
MASIYPFTKEELDKVHPDSLLCRMLSTKAILPISENSTQPALNGTQIGKGQCGEVHINDTTKVKKTPNLPERIVELRRDYHCHTAVVEAWRDAPSSLGHNISTPEVYNLSRPPHDDNGLGFWSTTMIYSPNAFSLFKRLYRRCCCGQCIPNLQRHSEQLV